MEHLIAIPKGQVCASENASLDLALHRTWAGCLTAAPLEAGGLGPSQVASLGGDRSSRKLWNLADCGQRFFFFSLFSVLLCRLSSLGFLDPFNTGDAPSKFSFERKENRSQMI